MYELGSEFYTSDSGVITELGCLCPQKNKTYIVSLWDFNSNALLAQANVTCIDSTHFAYANITTVHITANTPYVISYNNTVGGVEQGYYFPSLKSNVALGFPFSDGNVTFVATMDTLITSANVTCTDSTKFSYTSITPVHIIANSQYLLSNNTGPAANYFYIGLKSDANLSYPYSVGNITFTGYNYVLSTGGTFPAAADNQYLVNSDFVFKAD